MSAQQLLSRSEQTLLRQTCQCPGIFDIKDPYCTCAHIARLSSYSCCYTLQILCKIDGLFLSAWTAFFLEERNSVKTSQRNDMNSVGRAQEDLCAWNKNARTCPGTRPPKHHHRYAHRLSNSQHWLICLSRSKHPDWELFSNDSEVVRENHRMEELKN
eukprot:4170205-Amphidinium_carterae.1